MTKNNLMQKFSVFMAAFLIATLCMSCSKDKNKIAFATGRDGGLNIYVMNSDGSLQQKLTSTNLADDPAWSPDHKKIAYIDVTDGFQIYIMNADGSNTKKLTDDKLFKESSRWSPDGKTILFRGYPEGTKSELYLINTDGTGLKRLTNDDYYDNEPSWSPDGKKIVFVKIVTQNSKIFVMDKDGKNVKQLTKGEGRENDDTPSWSPDGKRILFSRNYMFITMKPDGTDVKELNGEVRGWEGVWSPDGKQIAYRSWPESDQIFVMNADGSKPVDITNSVNGNYNPAWK